MKINNLIKFKQKGFLIFSAIFTLNSFFVFAENPATNSAINNIEENDLIGREKSSANAGLLVSENASETNKDVRNASSSSATENGIELPDLTTIVAGSESVFSAEPIPDFSDVIAAENIQSNIQLKLPEVGLDESNSPVFLPTVQEDKGIYAEGKIGGGYPGAFIGEFSIMQDKGKNPFEIFYSHSSFDGYNGKPLYEGYSDNETIIKIKRDFNFNKSNFGFSGFYETFGNGLQNKVANVSAINQQAINALVKYDCNLIDTLVLGGDFNTDFYTRFANLSTALKNASLADSSDDLIWFKNYSYFNLNPQLFLTWNNSMFDAGLFGSYKFNREFGSDNLVHRGSLYEKFAWHYSYFDVFANLGLVFSNQVSQSVIVPFDLGVTYSFPVYFSDRKVTVSGEGGLCSEQNSVFDIEKKYKFSALNVLPGETSDWFGKIDFSVPLKASVTINGNLEYRHTAFENGVYEPIYGDDGFSNGIYRIEQKNRQLLKSALEFAYHYKLFAFSAGWYANWLDVPALENAQKFALSIGLQNEKSVWGVNLSGSYSMDAVDLMPWLDFEAFVRLNNAVRLVLNIDDGIKLITGQERNFVRNDKDGNQRYISRSGSATLLVKFFF